MSSPTTDLHIEAAPEASLADTLALLRKEGRHGEFDTGRYRCRYFTWGEGPPLVFIHGLCDRARSFAPMMAQLREHIQCVAYELSDGGADRARLEQSQHCHFVDDLFALVDHLRLRQAYLFGSSFGSTIALAAMLAQPERIPRAVLQGAFAQRSLVGWERISCQFLRYGRGLMGTLPLRQYLHPRAEHVPFVAHGKLEMWDFLMANSNDVSKSAAARRALMLDEIDLRPRLSAIRQPVLLISGENDSLVPKQCDRALLDGLPSVDRVEIPACGHYPQYSHAGLTAELTRQFLTAPECGNRPCVPPNC
jgi:pimeloyl-ACP methyl ester carboxylesterase